MNTRSSHDSTREFIRQQWVDRPTTAVFDFFSDAYNLERLTPPFLHFRVLEMTTPDIRAGTLIDYRLSLHGVPFRWRSRIQTCQVPRCFVDTQVRGPYKLWHHTHEFEERDGGTLIRDRVRYALPFGKLGSFVAGALVAKDLARIFDFRGQRIAEILGRNNSEATPRQRTLNG
jgi:ligand-binding SRPBCC domain-containing protein